MIHFISLIFVALAVAIPHPVAETEEKVDLESDFQVRIPT
jgi:hypothetical protein